jgi:asparagine synthetase B (glutamine-hydrolysing)
MCGIFGFIKPNKDTNVSFNLTDLFKKGLLNTQERGTDATGYYSIGTGVVKDAMPAKDFLNRGRVVNIDDERFVIGHCRAASSGLKHTVDDPRNAHPFESKNWILVHNGTIHMNHLKNYHYTSDVDSESILAYAETTTLKNAIASIEGGSTVVLYSKTQKKIYFWTDGQKPLCLAFYSNIIFFSSTKKILLKTLNVKKDVNIFPQISFATVYERELLEFDLVKNKFTRKGVIEQKKTIVHKIQNDESDDNDTPSFALPAPTPTYLVDNNYRPLISVKSFAKRDLPRGSGSNPPSNSRVVRIGINGAKIISSK